MVVLMTRSPLLPLLPRYDVRFDRHAWPERPPVAAPLRYLNANRNALHDLREIAGRVVGRQQRELGSGGRADTFDLAFSLASAVGIDVELGRASDFHVRELRFLEVRGHPHAGVGDDRHERLTRLHQLPDLDLLA